MDKCCYIFIIHLQYKNSRCIFIQSGLNFHWVPSCSAIWRVRAGDTAALPAPEASRIYNLAGSLIIYAELRHRPTPHTPTSSAISHGSLHMAWDNKYQAQLSQTHLPEVPGKENYAHSHLCWFLGTILGKGKQFSLSPNSWWYSTSTLYFYIIV